MNTDNLPHISTEDQDVIELPINGTLDLHSFKPSDIKFLIPDYIKECQKLKITNLRIIHGKGKGVLRRTVHAILERQPDVVHFKLADETGGSWGATLVTILEEEQP